MGQFINSINEVRKNYSKYDGWEQAQADERAKKEYLAKNLDIPKDKLELTQKRAETVIRATEIMDARSEDNCQNMEQFTNFLMLIPTIAMAFAQFPLLKRADNKIAKEYAAKKTALWQELSGNQIDSDTYSKRLTQLLNKQARAAKSATRKITFGTLGATFLVTIGGILWGNSQQKEASRIGRFQAKQNELKGLENFVVYTPEQLEKAKEIAKNIPDEKEKNSIAKMFSELKGISKDKQAYKQWLAEKDNKEIENLKSAELPNGEKLQRAQEDKELIVDAVKEINIKAEEYSENLENSFDTLGVLSWIFAIPLGFGINKLFNAFKVKNKAVQTATSVLVPILTPFFISAIGTFEEKRASRIGRFKARQDLMKNPTRLMAFSEEDMKKAESIKAEKQKQGLFEKLGGSFKFLSSYVKDAKEYEKYKKTTKKENEKIQKALKEIDVTDSQKMEAKALQKNVYRAFDEIDEMSQRYSEDTEAATEIAKQTGGIALNLASMGGLAWLGVSIVKGKFPTAKLINWITNKSFKADAPLKKAINDVYAVLQKQDKATVQKFQESLVTGNLENFLAYPQNSAIKKAMVPVMEEFRKIGAEDMIKAIFKNENNSLSAQFKQTGIAKWTRNMIIQCLKLKQKYNLSKEGIKIPLNEQKELGLNFNYKNYGTLINTSAVLGLPVLGILFGIPYAFNAWLTNIQKKAGKIGIMKAMDKIDDPKVFVSDLPQQQNFGSQNDVEKSKNQSGNLLDRFNR